MVMKIKSYNKKISKLTKNLMPLLLKKEYFAIIFINRLQYLVKSKMLMLAANNQNTDILENIFGVDVTKGKINLLDIS